MKKCIFLGLFLIVVLVAVSLFCFISSRRQSPVSSSPEAAAVIPFEQMAVTSNTDLRVVQQNANKAVPELETNATFPTKEAFTYIPFPSAQFSLHGPTNEQYCAELNSFIKTFNDSLREVSSLLTGTVFHVTEWNLSRETLIDINNQSRWRVYFNGPNHSASGITKEIFSDSTRQNKIRSLSFSISWYEGTNNIIREISRDDGSEYILFNDDSSIERYARKLAGGKWYSIIWDRNGNIVSENIRGPSKALIPSHKRIIEKYKEDPYMKDGVRQYEAELEEMQTNKNDKENL